MDGTRKTTRFSSFGLFTLVLCALMATSAQAQFRASLRGTITDPSGAVVLGAKLALTDKSTNQTLTAQTNASGVYTFNALATDYFRFTIEQKGFEK